MARTREQFIEWKGKSAEIRCENGPEYTGKALMSWAAKQNITLRFIQPDKPQQNACIERYNRTVRCDWLGQHLLSLQEELQGYATRWQWFNSSRASEYGTEWLHVDAAHSTHELIVLITPLKMGGLPFAQTAKCIFVTSWFSSIMCGGSGGEKYETSPYSGF